MIPNDLLVKRLRLAKPSKLRVFQVGREDADLLLVSPRRDRWTKAVDLLSTMDWTKVDCLDSQGCMIDSITAEIEGEQAAAAAGVEQSPEERWLAIMINAQRLALENHAHMLQPLINGYVQLANVFGQRLAALEKHFDQTLDVAYQNAMLRAQLEQGPDANEAVVNALIDKLGGKKKPRLPPNGTPEPTTP